MQLDRQELKALADKYNFIKDTFEKELRLIELLDEFQKRPLLKNSLALKGGTCINLFYLNGPRLSVDIDFDYVGKKSRDEMLKERDAINKEIKDITDRLNYVAHTKTKTYFALDSNVLGYENNAKMNDNIKIEINYLEREHVLPLQRRDIKVPWYGQKINVLCVSDLEIYGSKITALTTRCKARDLYDAVNLYKLMKDYPFNLEIVRKCAIFYRAIGTKEIDRVFDNDKILNLTDNVVKRTLQPVLRKGEFLDVERGFRTIEPFIQSTYELSRDEKNFLDNFEKGVYRPDLLFDSKEMIENVRYHPAAIWKCVNVIEGKYVEGRESSRKHGKDGPELGD